MTTHSTRRHRNLLLTFVAASALVGCGSSAPTSLDSDPTKPLGQGDSGTHAGQGPGIDAGGNNDTDGSDTDPPDASLAVDSGDTAVDSGLSPIDSGTHPADSGAHPADSGTREPDAGAHPPDAGAPRDAGHAEGGTVGGQIILGTYDYYEGESDDVTFIDTIGGSPSKSLMMEFIDGTTWSTAQASVNNYSAFASWPGPKVLGIPMQANSAPRTWTDVTGGSEDAVFTTIATWCHSNGVQFIREGWEFNGGWFPWGVGGFDNATNLAGFKATWIHIWNLFNAVAPGYFKFLWNPTDGVSAAMNDVEDYYPGDAYVDLVGIDVYDGFWGSWPGDSTFWGDVTNTKPGLSWLSTFAAAHGKAQALPEWSCMTGQMGPNESDSPGDDPTFVDEVFSWANGQAKAGQTVYLWPWNNGTWAISSFPNAYAQLGTSVKADVASGVIR